MPQIHLRAEVGDYAPLVLLPGDPNRATRIAESFDGGLEGPGWSTSTAACSATPARIRGTPVSVQTTGMGTPSLSIVVEELLRLGARRLVRVGTTGGHRTWHPHRRPHRRHVRGTRRRRDADVPARRPVRAGGRLRADARPRRRGARAKGVRAASSGRSRRSTSSTTPTTTT